MSTLVIRRATRPVAVSPLARAAFAGAPFALALQAPAAPAVVLERDGEDGVLTAEAPGLDAGRDLSVEVTGTALTVAGTRRSTSGGVRREARFSRSVRLPEGVGADAVTASYEAGVLRVRVAGMFPAPVQPETVRVAITSDAPVAVEAQADQAHADQAHADQA